MIPFQDCKINEVITAWGKALLGFSLSWAKWRDLTKDEFIALYSNDDKGSNQSVLLFRLNHIGVKPFLKLSDLL